MNVILIAVGLIAVGGMVGVITHAIVFLVNWSSTKGICEAQICFDSFRALYQINPDRWALHSSYVTSSVPSENDYSFFSSNCDLYFSIPDLIRYHRWKSNSEKQEKNARNSALYKRHIEFWQKDLEEYAKKLKEG